MATPDPKGFHTTEDGVVIPMGSNSKADISYSNLLYNEYPLRSPRAFGKEQLFVPAWSYICVMVTLSWGSFVCVCMCVCVCVCALTFQSV